MSISIENNQNGEITELFNQKAHYLPCKIEDNGPANVEKYFEPLIVDTDNGDLKATFRGYPLDGTKMSLPNGYCAVMVTETKRPLAEDVDRKFQVVCGFKQLTYWNWDKKPSKNDNLVKAMDWIDISEAPKCNAWSILPKRLVLPDTAQNHRFMENDVKWVTTSYAREVQSLLAGSNMVVE